MSNRRADEVAWKRPRLSCHLPGQGDYVATEVMTRPDFRTVFCQQAHCEASHFERALFWRGLYRHAIPFAFLIRLVAPRFFRDDLDFIRFLGADASMEEINEDIDRFQYGNRVRRHWLRTGFRIHLDPARIAALASTCLP